MRCFLFYIDGLFMSFSYKSVMTKNLFFVFEGVTVEHHSGDFSVVVRDVRQYSQQDSDA
jgi:hypothetical protein